MTTTLTKKPEYLRAFSLDQAYKIHASELSLLRCRRCKEIANFCSTFNHSSTQGNVYKYATLLQSPE
jgi:hypothetical protein